MHYFSSSNFHKVIGSPCSFCLSSDRPPGGGLSAEEGCRQPEAAGEGPEGETEPGVAKERGSIVGEKERSTEPRSGERMVEENLTEHKDSCHNLELIGCTYFDAECYQVRERQRTMSEQERREAAGILSTYKDDNKGKDKDDDKDEDGRTEEFSALALSTTKYIFCT